MDPNEGIDVPALTKIGEYLASGVGAVAGPLLAAWKARKESEAEGIAAHGKAEAERIVATGRADAMRIEAEGAAGAHQILTKASVETLDLLSNPRYELQGEVEIGDLIAQKIQFQEQKRLANQFSAVKGAIEAVGDSRVSDHEPDHDWTARYFNNVQDVTSEEMQRLWARILAGEVQRPGGTSLHTLSVLRNLDKQTASLFRILCSASVSLNYDGKTFQDARVLAMDGNAAENALENYGLPFDRLNLLHEHGLVVSDYNSWLDYSHCVVPLNGSGAERMAFSFQGRFWILRSTKQGAIDKEYRLHGVALTRAGRELSRVVELHPMEEYSQALAAFLDSKGLRMTEVGVDATSC